MRIGIPKGNLRPTSERILSLVCGYNCTIDDSLEFTYTSVQLGSINAYVLNPHDIPEAIVRGYIDLGITGSDIVREYCLKSKEERIHTVRGFPELQQWILAVVGKDSYTDQTIITEFPYITAAAFPTRALHPVRGSAEAWALLSQRCALTVVDTGATIKKNGLSIQHIVQDAYPVLIAHPNFISSVGGEKLRRLLQ